MRVIMAVIIDQAGRKFNVDETDGVRRRHRRADRCEPLRSTEHALREYLPHRKREKIGSAARAAGFAPALFHLGTVGRR
jgi:hypothetical protein